MNNLNNLFNWYNLSNHYNLVVSDYKLVFSAKNSQHSVSKRNTLVYSNSQWLRNGAKILFHTMCSLSTRFHQDSWGTNTMSATFLPTTRQVTFRSLTNHIIVKEKIRKTHTNPDFFTLLVFIIGTFLFLGQLIAEPGNANREAAEDVLRQDVLRFVGPNTANVAVTGDGYLIRLNRRTNDASKYGIIVYGVDPVERALLQDAQDGRWDNFDLFRAALIVDGIRDPNKIRDYEARLDKIVTEAKLQLQAARLDGSPEALPRKLFELLHQKILTSPYDIDCTALSKVLETGHFNCVSATILFNCLAYKAGLDVYALEMPGHALSRVKFKGTSIDIETTCPTWFQLKDETARKNATLQRIAVPVSAETSPVVGNQSSANSVANSPAKQNDVTKKLREISPVQLVATIYYNHGIDIHAEDRFPEAAMINVKALHLDPENEDAWGNLMGAINNWSLEFIKKNTPKRYDIAALLFDRGVYLDPNYNNFRTNQLCVYYHWIRDLALEGRNEDAKTIFALADQRLPGNKELATLMQAIEKR
ncbi:MAG: transglutaminase-like domain-containing protein [Planctomycetaceae bacterium]|jgi:tetratricopeptide (TPR) repeat protein|nr:transglutaminase-like domain-containing protein [Planctomycetaceae bacterium]